MTPLEKLHAAVAAACPITGCNSSGVIFPSADATPEQIAAGEAVAAAFNFALETAKVDRLASWYAAKLAAGILVGDTRLKALERDQTRFAALATALALGVKRLGLNSNDDCPSPIWDYNGVVHAMKVSEAETLLANYFLAIAAIETQYAVNETALSECTTVEQVNAVEMG